MTFFDGCFFDPSFFDATPCGAGGHIWKRRYWAMPIFPEPVPDKPDDTEERMAAVRAEVMAAIAAMWARERLAEEEWLLMDVA